MHFGYIINMLLISILRNSGVKMSYLYKPYEKKYICPQIRGVYSLFNYNIDKDIYRYGSSSRKKIKGSFFLKGTIEDHHIIPKTFKNHDVIKKTNFNVCCSNNLIIMPSLASIHILKNPNIIYHYSHYNYNKYVRKNLDIIDETSNSTDETKYMLWLLVKHLEDSILNNDFNLPWH